MSIDIIVPGVGESVTEAILAEWFKKDGDPVEQDEPIFVIETDKVTIEVAAEVDGILKINMPEGETVLIGSVVGTIDPAGAKAVTASDEKAVETPEKPVAKPPPPSAPEPTGEKRPKPPARIETDAILSPSVRRLAVEKQIDVSRISGTGPGGRITKGDVLLFLEQVEMKGDHPASKTKSPATTVEPSDENLTRRTRMTPIRKRIAERLLDARRNTAMLTTFNEIDMSRTMVMRKTYKESFQKKHGISLGFMSFFAGACVTALREVPEINAFIDGDEIVYHDYVHLGIAVGSGKGLVVPVLRHVERMSFADIEKAILTYVDKIKNNRLELSDLEGGTFTISNGGVYGSLLSTPILNTPQSGILGMHKIEKRPVVVDDEIVIRPMMYVALSYDHRVVDGKGAVTCLKRIKACVENPERMLMEV